MRTRDEEIARLREKLAVMRDEATKNETVWRRTVEREMALMRAESLNELFEFVVRGLADSFGLNAVTLILSDPQHEVRHLMMAMGMKPEEYPAVLLVDSMVGIAPQFVSMRRPWLGPYIGSDHQLVFPGITGLRSVALLPLLRQQVLVGSLNFGSADEARFSRHLAVDFLHHLSSIAAICVENAVNRARLVRSGITDVLTGWHNRRYLQTRMLEELARAQRERAPLGCLLLDIDAFKRINDTYGHLAGDNALREVAVRIDSQVRKSDVAARYGGEEFAVLLPHTTLEQASGLAERIRTCVSATPVQVQESAALTITISIGVAILEPGRHQADLKGLGEALLAQADMALYRAKAEGRDRVVVAPP